MSAYSLSHVGDQDLIRTLASLVSQERTTTAELIAHVAEVEERRLYAPAGYPSMFEYCVRELHMSEHAALRRIRVGKHARRFPEILPALADGRLHLTAVLLLAPHLRRKTAAGLIAAATHKTRSEIELMLAQRFPKADVATEVKPIVQDPVETSGERGCFPKLTESEIGIGNSNGHSVLGDQLAPAPVALGVPNIVSLTTSGPAEPRRLKPLSPGRFSVQFTMPERMHDQLRRAQELLGHQIPTGDIVQVLEKALDVLVEKLEKQKFAATDKPRSTSRSPRNPRTIPAHVKRAVQARDQGQCTFVSEHGKRCQARKFLEFDHIEPVARGGEATIANLRLRCRAHNQYEAEQAFGNGFMHQKRTNASQSLVGC